MAACYNNVSGTDEITQYNPNLTLVDYVTSAGDREDSSATHAVAMGILSDLLEWNELDPVDEYEIHRNNLIYNNYQHNRNPFVDFPQWANYIWGDKVGTAINSRNDRINGDSGRVVLSTKRVNVKVNESFELSATSEDNSPITWSVNDSSLVELSKTTSNSGEKISVKALKEGKAKITATITIDGETFTTTCTVTISPEGFKIQPWMIIVAAVVVVVIVIIIIAVPASRKKAKKIAKKTVKSAVKSQSKSSSKGKKK